MPPNDRKTSRGSGSGQNGRNGQGTGKQSAPSPALPSTANSPAATSTAVTLNSAEQQAVDELFATMKQTLATLGNTFDTLGKQTVAVASISPRVAAARELQQTREKLRERQERQQQRLDELKVSLMADVKDQREKWLQKKVDELVNEIVRNEVPRRVSQQVDALVSSDIKQQLIDYKRRILNAKVSLLNAEARRQNALLSSGNELLSPLLPRRLPPGKIELPKPPALLPKTIAGLVRLETPQISALLKEYEIEECKATPAASPLSPGGAAREANLDRLMVFLGVEFLSVSSPSATAQNGGGLRSPVVPRRFAWPTGSS